MTTLRSLLNFAFLGLWTAFMVIVAVSMSILRGDPEIFRRMQRRWASGLITFWGVKLQVHGAEHMDVARPYVVMSNHLSYVDIVVLFIALPTIPGFMAKSELMRVPFLAAALRHGRHVIIERKKHQSAKETLLRAAEQVRDDGKTVLIFPEGTRGDSDTIGSFKRGGFHLAKNAGVPILPVGVRGARSIFPRGAFLIRPGKLEVHIGRAVDEASVGELEMPELVEHLRARIMELSEMPRREGDRDSPPPA